jgi:hypothetical protein
MTTTIKIFRQNKVPKCTKHLKGTKQIISTRQNIDAIGKKSLFNRKEGVKRWEETSKQQEQC